MNVKLILTAVKSRQYKPLMVLIIALFIGKVDYDSMCLLWTELIVDNLFLQAGSAMKRS